MGGRSRRVGQQPPCRWLWPALTRLSGRLLARHDSLATSPQLETRRGRPSGDARGKGLDMGDACDSVDS